MGTVISKKKTMTLNFLEEELINLLFIFLNFF